MSELCLFSLEGKGVHYCNLKAFKIEKAIAFSLCTYEGGQS